MPVLAEGRALHGVGEGGTGVSLVIRRGRQISRDLVGGVVEMGSRSRFAHCGVRRQT